MRDKNKLFEAYIAEQEAQISKLKYSSSGDISETKAQFIAAMENNIYIVKQSLQKRENKPSDRIAKLKLYTRNGNPEDVLSEIVSGGGPVPRKITIVTRKRYFAIVDRILEHEKLVREIITEWRRQTLHWLAGAEEPLPYHYPAPSLFQRLCDPENASAASLIKASFSDTLEEQVVAERATVDDLTGISPLNREFIS